MMAFSSSPSPQRRPRALIASQPSSPVAVDWADAADYLSSDLDVSFASTMSINSAPTSPTIAARTSTTDDPFGVALRDRLVSRPNDHMDISPVVPFLAPRRNVMTASASRPFGTEVSNAPSSPTTAALPKAIINPQRPRSRTTAALPPIRKPLFERAPPSNASNQKPLARAALPNAWLQVPVPQPNVAQRAKRSGAIFSAKNGPRVLSPSTPPRSDDYSTMDLDVSMASASFIHHSSSAPASPTGSTRSEIPSLPPTSPETCARHQPDLSGLFYHSSSPEVPTYASLSSSSPGGFLGVPSKKRRSSEMDDHNEDDENEDDEDSTTGVMMSNLVPESSDKLSSSPLPSSPIMQQVHRRTKSRCIERANTVGSGAMLFPPRAPMQAAQSFGSATTNLALPGAPPAAPKRTLPKRPALTGLGVNPSRASSSSSTSSGRAVSTSAVLPLPSSQPIAPPPPVRRAFSAYVPSQFSGDTLTAKNGALLGMAMSDETEDEFNEGDSSMISSESIPRRPTAYVVQSQHQPLSRLNNMLDSPAQRAASRARRENIGRVGAAQRYSAQAVPTASVLAATGLPGFGDSEADGKILPCHKVREDGLMRISADTVHDLVHGVYDHEILSYTVIDCRFDYEHNGGHIPGAINLSTTEAIEAALLSEAEDLPTASRSGDGDIKKRVIVFHCEFSVKRAPTFAKHLRSKDRSMNQHVYPKVHYPEVYVLEGGYSQYYSQYAHVCEPQAYVRMDDPAHLRARANELNDFRRWNRTRSFTYGELQRGAATAAVSGISSGVARPVSTDSSSLFVNGKAPSGAQTNASTSGSGAPTFPRRPQLSTLQTLAEDGDSSFTSEPDPADESPCAPSRIAPFVPFTAATTMKTGAGSTTTSNVFLKPRGMQRALTTAVVGAGSRR